MNIQHYRDVGVGKITASSRGEQGGTPAVSEVGGGSDGADSDRDGGDAGPDADDPGIPKDVQYDILRNERRRLVLRYLFEEENPASLGDLSEHVAGVENDKDPRMLDSQERKRAYVGLYQCHLPRMHDAGVIDFNKARGVVELGTNADALLEHLEDPPEDDPAWARVYLLCSLVGMGVYLLTQSPVLGVGWLGTPVLALTLVLVAATSAVQLARRPDES